MRAAVWYSNTLHWKIHNIDSKAVKQRTSSATLHQCRVRQAQRGIEPVTPTTVIDNVISLKYVHPQGNVLTSSGSRRARNAFRAVRTPSTPRTGADA